MNNARTRAWQLHRAALAPKRNTQRVVGPRNESLVPMAARLEGAGCRACGYALCACHRQQAIAKPPPQPGAFVVPKGWRHESVGRCWLVKAEDDKGTAFNEGPCVFDDMNGYRASRSFCSNEPYQLFANPYAAMLCALGARVEPSGHEWRVWGPDKMGAPNQHGERYHGILDSMSLLALVERLTAERAAIARARQQGEQIGRELAREQQGEALAPGWEKAGKSRTHKSGAYVFPSSEQSGMYCYCSAESSRSYEGRAPTRDEAMALALGWERSKRCAVVPDWELKGADHGMCASSLDGSTWLAINDRDQHKDGLPSLPHAIAWARGDAP